MNRRLFAWDEQGLVGTFSENGRAPITFSYAPGRRLPISLSMPLAGSWSPQAPGNFLDGLLPDDDDERVRMKVSLHAASTGPFDLLDRVDSSGGLTFSLDAEPPESSPMPVSPASDADIEARIEQASTPRAAWWDQIDGRARFSLAGTQGKFTLTRLGQGWGWPSASLPSTHIIKVDARHAPGSMLVEDATMTLASACGLVVPRHSVLRFGDRDAYVVERFDRRPARGASAKGAPESPRTRRLRTEDLAQALGEGREKKYLIDICDVVPVLLSADASGELAYTWLSQVAFNAYACNADAHAKNYSLLLDGRVRVSPLYDSVCTWCWDGFDRGMAMPVNDKSYPQELTRDDWAREAEACGLDGGRVADEAVRVACSMRDAAPQACSGLPADLRESMLAAIDASTTGSLA